ncbi:hypothetical protein [Lysobacter gummosus]
MSRRDIVRALRRTGRRRRCKTRCEKRKRLASITSCKRLKTAS